VSSSVKSFPPNTHGSKPFSSQYAWFEAFFPPNTHGSKPFSSQYAWFKAFFHPIRMVRSLFPPNTHGSKPFSTQYAWFEAFFHPKRMVQSLFPPNTRWVLDRLHTGHLGTTMEVSAKKNVQEHVLCTYQKDNERSHL
jgi:hypothetical protein